VDFKNTIGLREAGDRSRALACGKRDHPLIAFDQRNQDELLASQFGGDPYRDARTDRLSSFWRQASARTDHWSNESMKREDRRGRKSGQDDNWFVVHNREAQWFSWFECHAMHKDSGFAEARYKGVRARAGPFLCASGENHHVAARESSAHFFSQNGSVIRQAPKCDSLPPGSTPRGENDGAVAVTTPR